MNYFVTCVVIGIMGHHLLRPFEEALYMHAVFMECVYAEDSYLN